MKALKKDGTGAIEVTNEIVDMIRHCNSMGVKCYPTTCPYSKECGDFFDSHGASPCGYMVVETTLSVYDELLTKVRGMNEDNQLTACGKLGYYECMIDVFPEHTEELAKDVSKLIISMVKDAF